MNHSDEEARRKLEKPQCTASQVIAFVRAHFTLAGGDVDESSAKELNSYDDRNYYVRVVDGTEYTLKVHNGVESQMPNLLAAQSGIMRHLNAHGVPAPMPVSPTSVSSSTTAAAATAVAGDAAAGDADDAERDWAFLELPLKGTRGEDATRMHAVRVLTWAGDVPIARKPNVTESSAAARGAFETEPTSVNAAAAVLMTG